MASDCCSHIVDLHFFFQIWKTGLNKISNGLRIFVTAGMRNVAFPCIVGLMIGIFCHLIDNGTDNFSLCANLISWNQASQVIHVKERADVQYTADRTCCLRDAPAFYVEFQIGGEEPVMYVQPVLFSEAEDFVQGLASSRRSASLSIKSPYPEDAPRESTIRIRRSG